MREYFTFNRLFKESINGLSDKDRLAMYEAIVSYALEMKEPELEGFPKTLFNLLRPKLDADIKRWNNGCKGGAPKGNENNRFSNGINEAQEKQQENTPEIGITLNVKVNKGTTINLCI